MEIKNKYITFLAILFSYYFCFLGSASSQVIETNLARIERICLLTADSILNIYNKKEGCIKVKYSDASFFVESALLSCAEKKNINIKICDSTEPSLYGVVRECRVFYKELNQDYVERKIIIETDFIINNLDKSLSRGIKHETNDTIQTLFLPQIENNEQAISRGISIANSSSNFFDKVIEPAIVLGSAALIVILLFTVRSK